MMLKILETALSERPICNIDWWKGDFVLVAGRLHRSWNTFVTHLEIMNRLLDYGLVRNQ